MIDGAQNFGQALDIYNKIDSDNYHARRHALDRMIHLCMSVNECRAADTAVETEIHDSDDKLVHIVRAKWENMYQSALPSVKSFKEARDLRDDIPPGVDKGPVSALAVQLASNSSEARNAYDHAPGCSDGKKYPLCRKAMAKWRQFSKAQIAQAKTMAEMNNAYDDAPADLNRMAKKKLQDACDQAATRAISYDSLVALRHDCPSNRKINDIITQLLLSQIRAAMTEEKAEKIAEKLGYDERGAAYTIIARKFYNAPQ